MENFIDPGLVPESIGGVPRKFLDEPQASSCGLKVARHGLSTVADDFTFMTMRFSTSQPTPSAVKAFDDDDDDDDGGGGGAGDDLVA